MAEAATVKDLAYDPADLWVLDHDDLRALEIGAAGLLSQRRGGPRRHQQRRLPGALAGQLSQGRQRQLMKGHGGGHRIT